MTLQDSDDLERFLRNADQINELVKEFNSSDVSCQEKALAKADQFISSLEQVEPCKTKINKTVINKNPSFENGPLNIQYESSQNPENFFRTLEKDAEERSQRRKMKEEKANELRELGNEAFTQGDYETAVRFYTEGLEQLRDMQALYTNRAQSRICYRKILEIEPQRETMVKAYLRQVDLEEKVALQEKAAWEELQAGTEQATAVLELLKKLDRPNEINLYYCGGLELLSQAIKDCTGQTLFRLNNGFSIINGNNIVRSCLSQNSKDPYAVDLCMSAVKLWRTVCTGNKQNQQLLMECPVTRQHMVQLLASPICEIQKESLELLSLYSQTQHGRDLLIGNLNLCQMAENLMSCVCRDTSSASALSILKNLAAENNKGKLERMLFWLSFDTQEHAVLASSRCLDLLSDSSGGVITRAAGLLSVLLPMSSDATQEVVRNGIVKKLLKILKVGGEMSSRYSIKALTVCTASIPQACEELVKLDKRLHTLRKLLGSIDELVVGNAALCMGHCLEVDGAASGLLGTDCVPLLLRHSAGDAKRAAVRQNAAITLGKLCKIEPRHMEKLRELHGLEILHSCVRLIT
ncbi:Tetratricopeptide repeat protein 12 [Anabarilius grahami]|uniref:Tetratricopeptide repeat protein 12 n=1 Tax=Anabarilius grahami TaxID=495550 RepID=A0A3N0Z4Y0_ANAGA|nr:Tetratricopeptide repeat protein 12 [Anabarilius grahami]